MSALRFLFLTLLLAVDSVLDSEGQRINKTAEAGQDVTLPCEHGKENIHIIVLEWSRPDLDPDIVIFYRDGRFDPDQQHPSFRNRVDLQDRQMKDGNVSLILKDVKINDAGTYECRVKTENDSVPELISSIHLVVSPPETQEGGDKEGGAALVLVVVLVASVLGIVVIAAVLFCKRKKTPPPPPEGAPVQPLV